jgi:glycosyltransferase involved in cell wall biosynthesis
VTTAPEFLPTTAARPSAAPLQSAYGTRATGAAADLTALRVLVVHEWLYTWGGAERVLDQILALFPQADLVASVVDPAIRDYNATTARSRELWVGKLPGARSHHRWSLPLQAVAFARLDTRDYDLVISSSHAFAKLVRCRRPTTHVCYCHSPPRYLWDLHDVYLRQATLPQHLALRALAPSLRQLDVWGAGRVDQFIANSDFVARRVREYYGRRAHVVYPPVSPKIEAPADRAREDFLLVLGRLVPYKRVDLAIRAAEMLGVRLVVAGDGPERKRLQAMAGPLTEFVGHVSEAEAGHLLATCAAFVFCAEEDFGIAPVEANAHGAPVVGYARGGLLETMVPGETAVLYHEQDVTALASAIRQCLAAEWNTGALRANAHRFGPERFRDEIASVVRHALGAARRAR